MADKTMEDIKSGKGIPPLSNDTSSSNQSGVTIEQRSQDGITHETFTYHEEKKADKND